MNVLDKIDKLRIERGWSINNLAMEAMLTQSTLNNLYMRKSEPKLSTLRAVCQAFGITLAEFFTDEGTGESPGVEPDDELIRRVVSLSREQKEAVLVLLRSVR